MMSGCASALSKQRVLDAQLSQPLDCANAHQQVAQLESQYVSGSSRVLNGIATVLPTSALINLISGEYVSRVKLASGEFNQKITDRVAEINQYCHQMLATKSNVITHSNLAPE